MNKRTVTRITKLAVTLVAVTIAAFIAAQNIDVDAPGRNPGTATNSSTQQVVAVIDGDTIKTVDAEGTVNRVRIIGIDTPEIGRGGTVDERWAQEARTALVALLDGQDVDLISDPSQGDVDRYGRLLRHLHTDAGNVAEQLLVQGAGHEYTYSKPYVGQAEFRNAENSARKAGAGLWGACTPTN
ncbi:MULTISPECIES: thermonuclease family protein [Leucobacter]|uniref:Endonuclease YncB, thermonuclease family n=1 Tax=Leucobacter chromiiresistens TaxID=1079994 RepID=A0A1H0YJA3_9MICO|nr:thermonuclease family protein [Leucobacter chromiiresistens]SDQ14976.1 Endonuclease YncB, thermonuclease family [Leucobacter chromiiresistens]